MSSLSPIHHISDSAALPALLDRLAARYRRERGLGQSSSMSQELAKELLDSVFFTLSVSTVTTGSLSEQLSAGQSVLVKKLEDAKALLQLVYETTPAAPWEGRQEELDCLARYIRRYDLYCLAHHAPEESVYPYLCPLPASAVGPDKCLLRLQFLLLENRILAAFSPKEVFWDAFVSQDRVLTENPCGLLLCNAAGRRLLKLPMDSQLLTPAQTSSLKGISLTEPLMELFAEIHLPDNAAEYGLHALLADGTAPPGGFLCQ